MACTACLVCLVSTVSGCHKNILGRASASSRHITKLEQSTFLSYYGFIKLSISGSTIGRPIDLLSQVEGCKSGRNWHQEKIEKNVLR